MEHVCTHTHSHTYANTTNRKYQVFKTSPCMPMLGPKTPQLGELAWGLLGWFSSPPGQEASWMRCTGGLARPALTSAFLVQWPAGRCLCAISSGPWEGEFPRRPRKELCAKQQNLCGPPGLLSEPLPGASLSEHHSPPSRFPQQAPRLLLVPVLMVKDTHTKCFLIITFMADAVISLDFTAISFPHRFILSYSP